MERAATTRFGGGRQTEGERHETGSPAPKRQEQHLNGAESQQRLWFSPTTSSDSRFSDRGTRISWSLLFRIMTWEWVRRWNRERGGRNLSSVIAAGFPVFHPHVSLRSGVEFWRGGNTRKQKCGRRRRLGDTQTFASHPVNFRLFTIFSPHLFCHHLGV